jgi:predicted O-methyltransferase YrrM
VVRIGESMINHTQIIYTIAGAIEAKSYLELGLYDGSTINKISQIVPTCVGVDINQVKIDGIFYLGTTDNFFKENQRTFDVIFIDADHSFPSVKKDFNNSLKCLNKYGVILLHDTDPISEKYLQAGYCNDAYKIIKYIELEHKDLNIITLPIQEAGISIVNHKRDRRTLLDE